MKRVILTGGAGYIGKCVAWKLRQMGTEPILIDNFSTSRGDQRLEFDLREVDLCDWAATRQAFREIGKVDAIVHLAARALVPESVREPGLYFRNNLGAAVNTIEAAAEIGAGLFLHSSSCVVYGIPATTPIVETTPLNPTSPYGDTKRMAELILDRVGARRGLRVLNLRYFNPGGSIAGRLGESHEPETHLIPNVVAAALEGKTVKIFGDDYDTPDGTCVRDYIHIEDLASAHWAALQYLARTESPVPALNVGAGAGSSVREVIAIASKALGCAIQTEVAARRPGDPPVLVADITLARKILAWEPRLSLSDVLLSHVQYLRNSGTTGSQRTL